MKPVEFAQVAAAFATFHQESARLFERTEAPEQYLRGLRCCNPTTTMPKIWPRSSTAQLHAACSAFGPSRRGTMRRWHLVNKAGAAPMPPASGVGARPASPEILRRYRRCLTAAGAGIITSPRACWLESAC